MNPTLQMNEEARTSRNPPRTADIVICIELEPFR